MKRKSLLSVLAFCLMLPCLFLFSACGKTPPPDDPPAEPIKLNTPVVSLNDDNSYTVTAIQETLDRSNLGGLKVGDLVNLERSMLMNGRLDGHIVQGHVDCTAVCESVEEVDGSHYYKFVYEVDPAMASKGYVTVEKGSVTVNGVSLTVCDSERNSFRVAIIPYTFEHTNFKDIVAGTRVNLEFDIIGKYLSRLMEFQNK